MISEAFVVPVVGRGDKWEMRGKVEGYNVLQEEEEDAEDDNDEEMLEEVCSQGQEHPEGK